MVVGARPQLNLLHSLCSDVAQKEHFLSRPTAPTEENTPDCTEWAAIDSRFSAQKQPSASLFGPLLLEEVVAMDFMILLLIQLGVVRRARTRNLPCSSCF